MKNLFTIFIILFIPKICQCQSTFFYTYGDTAKSHYDQGNTILQTEDGGYVAVGEYGRYSVGAPSHYYGDVYLIRTDKYGDTTWTKTYGDVNAWETAYSMAKTDDGGFIISAYIQYPLWQLWLIKIDSQGDSIWTKKYPVGKGYCIKQVNDEGYIITGFSYDEEIKSNIYLLKTNLQGNTLWLREYNNSNQDEGLSVQQTLDGGYIISGVTEFPEPRNLDMWIIRTDSQGDTLWTKTYGGDYIDVAHSICETEDGGFFISGEYTIDGELGLELHIWMLKTDSNGDTTWTKKINNGSWGDYAYSMKKTSDGGFIIVGETIYDNFDSEIYLIKLTEEGNYQWLSSIGSKFIDDFTNYSIEEYHFRGNYVEVTMDGGYIITGFRELCTSYGDYQDLFLAKVNNKGKITDVRDEKTNTTIDYTLLQNYPNPFNPITKIRFQIPERGLVSLKIYDLLGKEVITILNEVKKQGTYTVSWDGENKYGRTVSSGIYLYRLQSGLFSLCKKMIFMK